MKRFQDGMVVMAGVISLLLLANIVLGFTEPWLPQQTSWPTLETEVKGKQLAERRNYEVVFLGSSISEAAIDPDLVRRDAYNGSLPFSTPMSNLAWLRSEFEVTKGTVVVLGLTAWPFHETSDEDLLIRGIEAQNQGDEDMFSGVPLFRNKGLLADWYERSVRERSSISGLWTSSGHQTVYYDLPKVSVRNRIGEYGSPRMSDDVKAAVVEMSQYVTDAGGKMVLLIEPAPFPGDVDQVTVDGYITTLRDLASDLEIEFWDTYSMNWDYASFVDGLHFNKEGTVAYTAVIAELLDGLFDSIEG